MRRLSEKDVIRYNSKVNSSDEYNCWNWLASLHPGGYGAFRVGDETRTAHTVAWEIAYGTIPPGMYVCHKCDNRACCNPNHLFLSTNIGNMEDKVAKGRQSRGADIWSTRVTPTLVLEIRARYVENLYGYKRLADEYGIGAMTVRDIIKRVTWAYI